MDVKNHQMENIFYCPHCNRPITKNAQLQVWCYAYQNGADLFGSIPDYIQCIYEDCRGHIKSTKILSGKCDHPFAPGNHFKRNLGEVALTAIILSILFLKFILGWALIAAVFVGIIIGVIIASILTPLLDGLHVILRKK